MAVFRFTLPALVAQEFHEVAGFEFGTYLTLCFTLVPATQRLAVSALDLDLGAALGDVLGNVLAFRRKRHRVQIGMACAPAAGAFRVLDFIGREHHGQLHRVVRIHLAAVHEWDRGMLAIRPAEAHVEIGAVMRSLNIDRDAAALARNHRRFQFF